MTLSGSTREWATSADNPQGRAIIVRDENSPGTAATNDPETDSHSLTINLLAAVLALLFIEQALAWRFTVGAAVAILSFALAAIWTATQFL